MRQIDRIKSFLHNAPLALSLIFILTACPEDPEPDYTINLTLEDYLCTWVDLRVILPDSGDAKYFSVKSLNGEFEVRPTLGVIAADTIVHIDGLQPETEYSFRAYYLKHDRAVDSSEVVIIQTRETTSSDFHWEIDRIGVHPAHFNDVQIISEDDVWAVGDIRLEDTYTYDSAGVWQKPYSAAHWNGKEWILVRFIDETGYVIPPTGLHYFSDTSIWFTAGPILHYDGDTTKLMWMQNYSAGEYLNRVWGSAEDDIWFVGTEGLIVHYDGHSFNRVPTGNTIRYVDVEGTSDGKHVFVVGHNLKLPYECCVWHFFNGTGKIIYYTDDPNPGQNTYGSVYRVSVYESSAYFKTVAGLWVYDFLNGNSYLDPAIADAPITSLIVQDRNDILGICGDGSWAFYNGQNWTINDDFYWNWTISCHSGDFKSNLAVMVGITRDASQGMIIRGYR